MYIEMKTETGIKFTRLLRKTYSELRDRAREKGIVFKQEHFAELLDCNPKTMSAIMNKHQVQRIEWQLLLNVESLVGTETLRAALSWPEQKGKLPRIFSDEQDPEIRALLTSLFLKRGEGEKEGTGEAVTE